MLSALFNFGLPLLGLVGAVIAGVFVPSPLKRFCIEILLMASVSSLIYGQGRTDAEKACRYERADAVRAAERRVRLKMEGDVALLQRSLDELRRQETKSNDELAKLREEINRAPPAKADVPVPPIILKAVRGK